jgi:hypothetical protein
MVKDALRVTRKLSRQRGRNRFPRPKTFPSEELATIWAKAQGYENFRLENMKEEISQTKKIRVIVEV